MTFMRRFFQIYFYCQPEKNSHLLHNHKRDHIVTRWYETLAPSKNDPLFFSFSLLATRDLFLYYDHQANDNRVKKYKSV